MIKKHKDYVIFDEDMQILALAKSRMMDVRRPTAENLTRLRENYTDMVRRAAALGDRRSRKTLKRAVKIQGCSKTDVRRVMRMAKRSARRLRKIGANPVAVVDTLVIVG